MFTITSNVKQPTLILVFFLLACLATTTTTTTTTTTIVDDKPIMESFLEAVNPTPLGWSSNTHFCKWSGVTCDSNNRVTSINLVSKYLHGVLPPSFSFLSQLTNLSLQKNHFHGPLPSLTNLFFLQEVNLENNNFTSVKRGAFSGLTSLQSLSLSGNIHLSPWSFPDELSQSTKLVRFYASKVNLVGTIPEIFGSFSLLQDLRLSFNGLNGTLPKTFNNSAIQNLWVNNQIDGLSGSIEVISGMTQLRQVWLQSNEFTGTIPSNLRFLPQLVHLDVSHNHLSGMIPAFRPGVTVLTVGNEFRTDLVHKPASSSSSVFKYTSRNVGKALKAALVPLVLTVMLCILGMAYKCKKLQIDIEEDEMDGSFELQQNVPFRFTYEMLLRATNNFDKQNKLGVGGFGSVFKGRLTDDTVVAVKRLDHLGQGQKEFLAEVQTIGCIHHVNLVKLVGFCAENKHRLLVYMYMSNCSLDKWIFNINLRGALSYQVKKKIILQIAKGLAYLHEECHKKILHLDVKPQNVLLDDHFNARLSDFGLAKQLDRDQSCTMTQMRGTRGYLAPEWICRKVTEKADVYSYGVVVLETIFGRKSLDYSKIEYSDTLIQIVKQNVLEGNNLSDLLADCSEDIQRNSEDIWRILKLAVWCLQVEPARRPSMTQVVKVLQGSEVLEAVTDYCAVSIALDENPASEALTEITVSILSGPR